MIPKQRSSNKLNKFSISYYWRDVQGSVWRICIPISRYRGLKLSPIFAKTYLLLLLKNELYLIGYLESEKFNQNCMYYLNYRKMCR